MAMVSLMLSTACSALGRHENLVKHHFHHFPPFSTIFHRFSPFFTVSPGFSVFHGPGGELVTAVAVTLRACTRQLHEGVHNAACLAL